jgi:hypothetical protein
MSDAKSDFENRISTRKALLRASFQGERNLLNQALHCNLQKAVFLTLSQFNRCVDAVNLAPVGTELPFSNLEMFIFPVKHFRDVKGESSDAIGQL